MATTTTAGTGTVPTAGGTAPPDGRPAVVPRPRPSPGRAGGRRLGQLVLIEVAVALLLTAWAVRPWLLVPAAPPAAALVLLAVVRRRRRPAVQWLAAAVALRGRRRRAGTPPPDGVAPGFAPAAECDPTLRTLACTGREGREVGMVGDGTFLTAVLHVRAADLPLRPARTAAPLPLSLLHAALDTDGIRLESVQVVQHTRPAPATHLPPESVAARNYALLQAGSRTPATRLTWVALKLDPQLCPEAVRARGGGLPGAQRALLRAADGLAGRLAAAGLTASPLTEAELTDAVAAACCADPAAGRQAGQGGPAPRRTAETARTWRCDGGWHTVYWMAGWPRLGPAGGAEPVPELVATLTSAPALASTFSLTAGRGPDGAAELTGHVRVTGRSDGELVAARRWLQQAAAGAQVDLVRLDREQVPGVLATLPLGGAR